MKYLPRTLKKPIVTALMLAFGLSASSAQDAAADAKLSQALGFAARLHSDTEMVMGMRNLEKLSKSIAGSNTMKRISGLLSEAGIDLSEGEEPWAEVLNYIGKDVFFAFGKGSAANLERMMEIYDAYYRIYYKFAAQAMLANMDLGDGPVGAEDIEDVVTRALKEDEGELLTTLEELQLPPIIMGCRAGGDRAKQITGFLEEMEAELPPVVLTSEFDVPGAGKFRSWSIAAKDAFEDHYRNKMREEIGDDELADRIEKIIDSKKVEFSFGVSGGYLIFGIGPDHSHMKLAANGGESLLTNPDFEFIKGYADKQLLGYSYSIKGVLSALSRPEQYGVLTDAAVDVLKAMNEGGIKVADAIPMVKKLGKQMVKASRREVDSRAAVLYVEDGLKGASIGGYEWPGIDAETPLKFAGAVPEDAFLTINAAADPAVEGDSIEMMETLAGAAYHVASGVANADGNEDFAEPFGMFDEVFRPKLLKVWGIMKNKVSKGLGHEGGLVIDLKGSMPKIPGAPAVLLEEGKLPRIALYNSVRERKLLTEAWTELVPALNDIAKAVPGQEPGREFQIPDPLSSDGKDVTTHFMGLPFVSNDFLPSLSISDEMFFLSTSKNFSEELAAKIAAGGGEKVTGVLFKLSLAALHDYAEGWLDLVSENADELGVPPDFEEAEPQIRMALEMLKGLKGFSLHKYKDDRWRTEWHLHITDIEE